MDVLVDACGNQVEPPAGPGGGGRDLRVTDEDLVQLTARLFRQFVSVEQAVVEIVFDLLGEGMVRNQLPGHVGNLRGYTSQLIHQGSSDAVEKIQDYLGDINLWIVAILAAGVRVSQQWWSDWWEVIQPRAIEERVLKDQREGGIAAKLFGSKLQDSWKKYRELARDLHPAEIKGQLQRRLGELTRREFEKQKGGPIPPVS